MKFVFDNAHVEIDVTAGAEVNVSVNVNRNEGTYVDAICVASVDAHA